MLSWFTELRERNVFKVGGAYLVVGWLVLQLGSLLFTNFGAPAWVTKTFTAVVFLGFPLALLLAWALEITPQGIRVTRSTPAPGEVNEHSGGSSAEPAYGVADPQTAAASLTAGASRRAAAPHADRPTIAVLPLHNMSGDPAQEFFVDGITEDILTELSRFRELFVISRTSSFRYKGQSVGVRQVGAELGVQYVLEGSVRKAGNSIRLSVQLIDAEADTPIWAERYDRELADIFSIQDQLAGTIVSVLPRRIEAARSERAARKTTDNMAAYELVLTGKRLHHRGTREDNAAALATLDRAIALDPGYAHAHAWRGCTLGQAWANGWCADLQATIDDMVGSIQTALALDANDSDVHRILAAVYLAQHQPERCLHHQRRALELNPNDDLIVVQQGEILTWQGQANEGVEWVLKAMRLNPYHPERFWGHLGRAYCTARRYPEAVEALQHINTPNEAQLAFLTAAVAQAGNASEAAALAARLRATAPGFSTAQFLSTLHYFNDADREHLRESLQKAGLPA
jgi:adenylate cyclase